MRAGSTTYLLLGIGGAFVTLMNLGRLLSSQGDIFDIFGACFFTLVSVEGFVSYLRIKGKTEFHFIS